METILELRKISKNFFGFPALKRISFSLKKGELLALVGENGAGKSTLMNVLGGVIPPTEGEMFLNGKFYTPDSPLDADRAGIAFIHQELNLFSNLSVIENIFIPDYPKKNKIPFIHYKRIYDEILNLLKDFNLDISPHTHLESLSPGDKQLIEIIKSIRKNGDIYIFDEPTTSLTFNKKKILFKNIKALQKKGKAIIYISHILEDVMELSDSILVLRDGVVNSFGQTREYTIPKIVEDMVGRELKDVYPPNHGTLPKGDFLELENFGKKDVAEEINFNVQKGEIVGMFGLMGSGRTELARMVFGLDNHETGSVKLNGKQIHKPNPALMIHQGVAFITEDRRGEGLMMDMSILFNISLIVIKKFIQRLSRKLNRKKLKISGEEMRDKLNIKANSLKQKVKYLSGGNQQKVVLGKWLLAKPSLLILDEPTRGVDVGAKYEIYSIINDLAKSGIAVWVISSELDELMGICDQISVMSRGRIVDSFQRNQFLDRDIVAAAFNNQ